jgi:hypothetical protein
VVYVDNDPVVLTHAQVLLTSAPQGVTSYIDADARDPGTTLAEARTVLDLAARYCRRLEAGALPGLESRGVE